MSIANQGLALLAGALSTLSPCVLPLVPIVVGTAAGNHRYGPIALAAGLALSFTAIGLFVATIGFSIGLDTAVFRTLAAVLLILIGVVLIVPELQERFSVAASPLGNLAQSMFGGFSSDGLAGQFAVGLLLGAVWSPCAGPTLGAASVLASQGKELGTVALTMGLFGLGAALPLLGIGLLSRERALKMRNSLMSAGRSMRIGLGSVLAVIGSAILVGADKYLEAWLVSISPDWLVRLTTAI